MCPTRLPSFPKVETLIDRPNPLSLASVPLPPGLTLDAVQGVFERCPLGIIQIDAQVNIVYANRVALGILGVDNAGELSLLDFVDDANKTILKDRFAHRLAGRTEEYDLDFRNARTGLNIPVRVAAVPIVSSNGTVTGSFGIFRSSLHERALEIVDRATKRGRNCHAILCDIAEGLNHVMPFDLCLVSIFNEDNTNSRTVLAWSPGESPKWPSKGYEFNPALAAWSRKPEMYVVNDSTGFSNRFGIVRKQQDPQLRGFDRTPSSFVRCPVVFENRVIAGVIILRRRKNGFSESDVDLLRRLPFDKAVLAALYLEKIEDLSFKEALLSDLSTNQSLQLFNENVAALIVTRLAKRYDWDNISIFRVDRQTRQFRLIAQSTKHGCRLSDNYSQPFGEGILGAALIQIKPLNIPDVHEDKRYKSTCPDTRSELCMRILQGGNVVGLLNIEDSRTNAFSKEEVRALEDLLREIGELLERRRTDNLINATFQCTPAAVIAVYSDGSIVKTNPAATELLGYSEEDFRRKTLRDVFVDPAIADIVVNAKTATSADVILRRKDGSEVKVMLGGSSLADQSGVVISCRDLTSYQREEELQQLNQIFHELASQTKPPLALTFDWLRQLREQLRQKNDGGEKQVDLIDKVIRQMRKVQLTYDRLAFYQSRKKAAPENVILLDARRLTDDILSEFPQSEADQVSIDWQATQVLLKVDPAQVSFSLQTTLSYLLRFLPQNETLKVHAENREVKGRPVLCIVIDSVAPPASEPGSRKADIYLARVRNDLSFGLQSVTQLVRGNGGVFRRFDEEEGRQRFEFEFPVVREEAA